MTETWLKPNLQVCIPKGYNIIRKDRVTHAGGVAVLYKNNLKAKELEIKIDEWLTPSSIELICISFQYEYNKSFLVCVLYRTELQSNDLHNLDLLFSNLLSLKKRFYVLGDFNFNMFSKEAGPNRLNTIIHKYNLRQLVIDPTRGDSLLDLVITNDELSSNAVVEECFLSDHCLTSVEIHFFGILSSKSELIKYRDYKSINIESLNSLVRSTSFIFDENLGIDRYFESLVATIMNIFDILAPIKSKRVLKKEFNFPISEKVKSLKKEAFFHYKRFKSTNILSHFELNLQIRKEIKKYSKEDVMKFVASNIQNKGIWDTIDNVFNLSFKGKGSCSYDELDANTLNKYFTDLPFPPGTIPYDTLMNSNCYDNIEGSNMFSVTNVTELELHNAWKKMKKKYSAFADSTGLSKKMFSVLFTFPNFFQSVLSFCNLSFKTGEVPTILKVSRIVPIPKCKNASRENEFRPIAISPFIMTLLEKIYLQRLQPFVEEQKFLSKYQFGSRAGHSTEHAMISAVDMIRRKVDEGMVCAIVSLDLRNAFPSVHREKLLQKISTKYHISDHWLRNYLANRKQFVDLNGLYSETRDMLIGLVQGSVLGPSFFTFFINDLVEILQIAVPEIFVDDTNLIFFDDVKNRDILTDNIENELCRVNDWVLSNSLALNTDKTKLMLISTQKKLNLIGNFSVLFNGAIIQTCNNIKCLGLTIDSTLSWDLHISKMVRACHNRINSLYKLKDFISNEYKIMLGQALVMSLINYMSTIWGSTTNKNLKAVEKVIRSLARFVSGKNKYDSIAPTVCNDLKWFFPDELCQYNTLCVYYKLYKCLHIDAFADLFNLRSDVHRYPTRSSTDSSCGFAPKSKYGYATFYFKSTTFWNNLPVYIREASSLKIFKKQLKLFLLNSQKVRLEVN
jgi:hypothetical protein